MTKDLYLDYCEINVWWDECETMNLVKNGAVILNEDFTVTKTNGALCIISHGHDLFKFVPKPDKTVDYYVTIACDVELFDIIYNTFMSEIKSAYNQLIAESTIKEMVNEANVDDLINGLVKKYRKQQ